MAACCKLEGGLYSANVVLGRLFDVCTPEVDAMVQGVLGCAADMATHHTSKRGHDMAWCKQLSQLTKASCSCFPVSSTANSRSIYLPLLWQM